MPGSWPRPRPRPWPWRERALQWRRGRRAGAQRVRGRVVRAEREPGPAGRGRGEQDGAAGRSEGSERSGLVLKRRYLERGWTHSRPGEGAREWGTVDFVLAPSTIMSCR